MLAAAERYGADVVRGRHVWVAPDPAPFWYEPPDPPKYAEGESIEHAGGGNVLFAGRLTSQRFDERLAHGEDTDFFYRATRRGARIVYSSKPVVYETSPPQRATLRYQVMRAFYYAASRANFERRHKRWGKAVAKVLVRFLWQVPIAIIRLVTAPLMLPFSRRLFRRHVLKGLSRLMTAAGTVVGLAGCTGNPYRNLT